jgi:glycosyltransferase involved in cell wall biosynthesis
MWAGARAVAAVVAQRPVDLIHANSTTAALLSARAARSLGVPLVWHVRDLAPLGRWSRLLARRCAKIVAVSHCTETLVRSWADPRQVVRIANGVETERFVRAAAAVDAAARHPGTYHVVSIGQLVEWKGIDAVLDCAAMLTRSMPHVRFVVAGREPAGEAGMRARLQQRIQASGLAGVVHMVGFAADVASLLARADVLIHTAYPEPFGRVIVEAMAAALPVLAWDGDHGPAEILREGGGRLLSPRAPGTMADALCDLLARPDLRHALGAEGRRIAVQRYDRLTMARACSDLYAGLLR